MVRGLGRNAGGVTCAACGRVWRARTARYCGSCGAALGAPGDVAAEPGASGPGLSRGWVLLVVAALVTAGATFAAVQAEQLPSLGPGDAAGPLPGDLEEQEPADVPTEAATDADGSPRCRTTTYAVDCVAWSIPLAESDNQMYGTPVNGGRLLVRAGPGVVAMIDVERPRKVWTHRARGHGQMHVAGGMVVLQDRPRQLAGLDLDTGAEMWRRDDLVGEQDPGEEDRPPLQFDTPPDDRDGPLLVTATDAERIRLVALDGATGETLWRTPLGRDDWVSSHGSMPLVVSHGSSRPGTGDDPVEHRTRALDRETGETRWRIDGTPTGPGWYGASRDGDRLLLTDGSEITVADPASGASLLRVPGEQGAFVGDDALLALDGAVLTRYRIADGERQWRTPITDGGGGGGFSLTVADDVARLFRPMNSGDGEVRAVDAATGEILADTEADGAPFAGPVAPGGITPARVVEDDDGDHVEVREGDRTFELPLEPGHDVQHATAAPPIVVTHGAGGIDNLRHVDRPERVWRLGDERLTVVSQDPLVLGHGGTLLGIDPDALAE